MSEPTELRRLLREGTPGPWKVWSSLYEGMAAAVVRDVEPLKTVAEVRDFKDAQKIAAALSALPGLLDRVEALEGKLTQVAEWLERNADRSEAQAKTCGFVTLAEAHRADAKNYHATAKDIRSALSPTTPEATDEQTNG